MAPRWRAGGLVGWKAAAAHTGDAHGEEASAEAAPKAKALPMGGKLSLSARGTTDGKEKGSTCDAAEGGAVESDARALPFTRSHEELLRSINQPTLSAEERAGYRQRLIDLNPCSSPNPSPHPSPHPSPLTL